MDAKNIQEYVAKTVIEYAFEHNKLKRKYEQLKNNTKDVICKHCKQYSRNIMGKRCGHKQCHPCWFAENSLIFKTDDVKDRNICLRCWVKNRSIDDLKNIVSESQLEHFKDYFSHYKGMVIGVN